MCCLLLGSKRKYINKIPRKSQESVGTVLGQSLDNPGTIPWNFVHVFSCLLCFFGRLKGGNGKGGIRIYLPVHCLSARSDRQPDSHKCDILALLKDDQIVRDNCLPVHCRHVACRGDIVLWSRSPRKCRYPLFAYLLTPCLNVPKFSCGFWVDIFFLFFPKAKTSPVKFTWKSVRKNSPRISAEAFSWEILGPMGARMFYPLLGWRLAPS